MSKKKKPTKEECINFLSKIGTLKEAEHPVDEGEKYLYWASKIDGSFLCLKDLEQDISYLIHHGITDQVRGVIPNTTAQIGFNPNTQQWFGWSHRAIYGFGIGSECKPGHVHYYPSNKKEYIDSILEWYDDEYVEWVKVTEKSPENSEDGVFIEKKYTDEIPNKSLRGQKVEIFAAFPEEYGKGEWVAETMEDAKQMAIDFARGIS